MKHPDPSELPKSFPLEGHPAYSKHLPVPVGENNKHVFLFLDLLGDLSVDEALMLSLIYKLKLSKLRLRKMSFWLTRSTFDRRFKSLETHKLIEEHEGVMAINETNFTTFLETKEIPQRTKENNLVGGKFLVLNITLIEDYSVNAAIILELVHGWHRHVLSTVKDLHESDYFRYGMPWLRRSVLNIFKRDLPFMKIGVLKKAIKAISTSIPEEFKNYPLAQVKFGDCRNVSYWSVNYAFLQDKYNTDLIKCTYTDLVISLLRESTDTQINREINIFFNYLLKTFQRKNGSSISKKQCLELLLEVLILEFKSRSKISLETFIIYRYRRLGVKLLLMDLIRVATSTLINKGHYFPLINKMDLLLRCSKEPKKDAEDLLVFIKAVGGMKDFLDIYVDYLLETPGIYQYVGHLRYEWKRYSEECL